MRWFGMMIGCAFLPHLSVIEDVSIAGATLEERSHSKYDVPPA
jgi:hypothetical protein